MIPFVMLPVLDSNLYPMRVSIWAFLEVTVLSQSYFLYRKMKRGAFGEKQSDSASQDAKRLTEEDKKLSDDFSTTSVLACGKTRKDLAVICVIAAVVTVWRTEAIYYLVFFPILLFLIAGKEKRIRAGKYLILYGLCFLVLFVPQKVGEKITSGSQYELTSMVLPLAELIRAADENGSEEDAALLSQIDRVIDIQTVLEGEGRKKNGIQLFWSEPGFQREYNEEDFAACKAAYRKLILKHPDVFLAERVKTFLESSDLLMNTTQLTTDQENENYRQFASYPLSKPLSVSLRNAVVCFLEQRVQGDYETKYPWANAVYSVILPLVLLAAALIALAWKRKGAECFVLVCSLIKVPLVFLTAPSRLFMYYYPVFLFGYCVVFYLLFRFLSAGKGQERVMK